MTSCQPANETAVRARRDTMSSRDRWLAALEHQPVDRLPFWPKLNGSYAPAQEDRVASMTVEDIHRYIGSDMHLGVGGCTTCRHRKGDFKVETRNGQRIQQFKSPAGTLERVSHWDENSKSWHPAKMPVQSEEDIDVYRAWIEDQDVVLDETALDNHLARARELRAKGEGVLVTSVGESPLMEWVEWIAGVENAHYLLADCPDKVEALFESLQAVLMRKAELMADHIQADLIYMVENTSTTLISPDQYRTYCLPHLTAIREILHAKDKRLGLHMCGLLKDLLPDIRKVGARAFEAFTSPTLGNTTLLDGRSACPDTCLIGGTNATLWTQPAEIIIATLERDLAELPHHRGLVVTSAGVMPPLAPPDRIRVRRAVEVRQEQWPRGPERGRILHADRRRGQGEPLREHVRPLLQVLDRERVPALAKRARRHGDAARGPALLREPVRTPEEFGAVQRNRDAGGAGPVVVLAVQDQLRRARRVVRGERRPHAGAVRAARPDEDRRATGTRPRVRLGAGSALEQGGGELPPPPVRQGPGPRFLRRFASARDRREDRRRERRCQPSRRPMPPKFRPFHLRFPPCVLDIPAPPRSRHASSLSSASAGGSTIRRLRGPVRIISMQSAPARRPSSSSGCTTRGGAAPEKVPAGGRS